MKAPEGWCEIYAQEIDIVHLLAKKVVAAAVSRWCTTEDSDHLGGYLAWSKMSWPQKVLIFEKIGQVGGGREEECKILTREKFYRLLSHPTHSSSLESRDPEGMVLFPDGSFRKLGHWGGAVRVIRHASKEVDEEYLFSFSGPQNELIDEAVDLVTATKLRLQSEAETLARYSEERNQYLRELFSLTRW